MDIRAFQAFPCFCKEVKISQGLHIPLVCIWISASNDDLHGLVSGMGLLSHQ